MSYIVNEDANVLPPTRAERMAVYFGDVLLVVSILGFMFQYFGTDTFLVERIQLSAISSVLLLMIGLVSIAAGLYNQRVAENFFKIVTIASISIFATTALLTSAEVLNGSKEVLITMLLCISSIVVSLAVLSPAKHIVWEKSGGLNNPLQGFTK